VPGKVEAVDYKEALRKIKVLKNELVKKLDGLDRSKGEYLSLSIYALAICAQEQLIYSLNDELISSNVPWDVGSDLPPISSTIGDAISYAERLKDPKDYFLKALLLSFSGWALFCTDDMACACGKGNLRDMSVDVLVQTNMQIMKIPKEWPLDWPYIDVNFFVGVQSRDHEHLELHYGFKKQSVKYQGLIIIFSSKGAMFRGESKEIIYYWRGVEQAEQFRTSKMVEIVDGLISNFNKEA